MFGDAARLLIIEELASDDAPFEAPPEANSSGKTGAGIGATLGFVTPVFGSFDFAVRADERCENVDSPLEGCGADCAGAEDEAGADEPALNSFSRALSSNAESAEFSGSCVFELLMRARFSSFRFASFRFASFPLASNDVSRDDVSLDKSPSAFFDEVGGAITGATCVDGGATLVDAPSVVDDFEYSRETLRDD